MTSVRGSLSRERIVDAALELIDGHGLEALSMRRLGASLGCEAMSLYKYVTDKHELLDLVVERVMAEMELPDPNAPWEDRVRGVATELRRVGLTHPQVFARLASRLPATPTALAPVEATLAALRAAGLDDGECASRFWALVAYTTGAIIGEIGAMTGPSSFPRDAVDLDPERFPSLLSLGAALASCDFAEEYERGLDSIIASVRLVTSDLLM